MLLRPLCLVLVLTACAPEPARSEASSPPVSAAAVTPGEPAAPIPVVAAAPAATANAPNIAAPPEANDPRWHPLLQEIAAHYSDWGRVDDQMRWAPTLCAMPQPARARISASSHESTHGRKLYTLYAKDPVAYGVPRASRPLPNTPASLASRRCVVKEAFRPVEAAKERVGSVAICCLPSTRESATCLASRWVSTSCSSRAKPVAETDAGWVYGTIAADGTTVTSAGKRRQLHGLPRRCEARASVRHGPDQSPTRARAPTADIKSRVDPSTGPNGGQPAQMRR
jgi:hypothetical protein